MIRAGFSLELATEEDLDAIMALEQTSFSHPWSRQNFRDVLTRTRGDLLVLRAPPRAEGPARGLLAYCVIQDVAGELHIHNLAVRPDLRRRGLARRLLTRALDIGLRRGATRAFLEVRASNTAARRLYESMGFRQMSVRRDYYVHPTEDALVLLKDPLSTALK